MAFWDFYRLFTYAFTDDPLARKKDKRRLSGAGVTQPDAMPDLRNADGFTAGSGAFIRVQNDLIDVTSTSNRLNRYKEYDRLAASLPEIDMSMTVFADEACFAANTKVSTVFQGLQTIKWITENMPTERFPVYCYSFEKNDFTIGWAYNPRVVKKAKTIKLILSDGSFVDVTEDHRILIRDGIWKCAGDLKLKDELMPFNKVKANQNLTKIKTHQFPRIFTFSKGWIHERQFIDEWRFGGEELEEYKKLNQCTLCAAQGMTLASIAKKYSVKPNTVSYWLWKGGFTAKELRTLTKNFAKRTIVDIRPSWIDEDVYDLSVDTHENFCTDSIVLHNCQKDENGKVFKIEVQNDRIKKELEVLFFNRNNLNFNQRDLWDKMRRLFIAGDEFWEIVIDPDNPKAGIQKIVDLPPDSMYRIETTKGKLIEFQQGKEGPDYQSIAAAPITIATDTEMAQSTAVRFAPEQIVHTRIGDYRKSFYPYGVSLIEPARGPAHQLRMMEDSVVVYRLTRAPERRIFYIDVGQLPPFKAEAFMKRIKDQFRKKKVVRGSGSGGPSAVEERYHAPAMDEDFWFPIRPGSSTKIETLPGASQLGEIDDVVYFRNKLFAALGMPLNYFALEDPSQTRISLSSQNVKFARLIERLQSYMEDSLWVVADRHLRLIGVPEESYEDLEIRMTPPSDWRELSRAEIISNRINNANSLKGAGIYSDKDILTKILKFTSDEADEMIARLKIQKLEDMRLQILQQNPVLLGVGIPGGDEQEIGAEPGGPNPNLGEEMPSQEESPNLGLNNEQPQEMPPQEQAEPLPEPDDEDINNYDLSIEDYDTDQDVENIDYSEIQ